MKYKYKEILNFNFNRILGMINQYPYFRKHFIIVYLVISFVIFCFSVLNFYISTGIIKYISYALYLLIFILSILCEYNQKRVIIGYIGGILMLLSVWTINDFFIWLCTLIFLLFILKKINKFRWIYNIITYLYIGLLCLSLCLSIFLNILTSREPGIFCDTSPSGNKSLTKTVYDNGATGYSVTYYITEKYGLFERNYIVAVRGRHIDFSGKFIDETTLQIQGIIYDISGCDVVFKQGGTDEILHRKKRKAILFIF